MATNQKAGCSNHSGRTITHYSLLLSDTRLVSVRLATLGFLLVQLASAIPPSESLARLTVRHWNTTSGLPEESFPSVLTSNGVHLWIASNNGLIRFDGRQAETFRLGDAFANEANSACAVNTFSALAADSTGRVWAGTQRGCLFEILPDRLGTFANFRYHAFEAPGMQPSLSAVAGITPLPDGQLMIVRRSHITTWRPPAAEAFRAPHLHPIPATPAILPPDGLQILFSSLARDGTIWAILSDRSVYSWNAAATRWLKHFTVTGAPRRMILSSDGKTLWVGTTQGLFSWTGGKLIQYNPANSGIPAREVGTLHRDSHGCIWFGGAQFLGRICEGRIETLPLGVDTEEIHSSLTEDPQGNVWVGGRWGNLYRLSPTVFRIFTRRHGLPESHLTAITVDRTGHVWGGLRSKGIFRLDQTGNVQSFQEPEIAEVQALIPLGSEEVLAATQSGLHRIGPQGKQPFPLAPTPDHKPLAALFPLDDNHILYSHSGGNYHFTRTGLTWQSAPISNPVRMRQWARDSHSRVWALSQNDGLFRWHNGSYQSVPGAASPSTRFWYSLHADEENLLWVGSSEGLSVYSPATNHFLSPRHFLPGDHVFHISADNFGHLWCSSRNGLIRLDRRLALAAIKANQTVIPFDRFTAEQGLPTSNFGLATSSAGTATADGRLWFPGLLGLVSLNPADFERPALDPAPLLLQMAVDGARRDLNSLDPIPPGTRRIAFNFRLVRLDPLGGDYCRLRLIPFDTEWQTCNAGLSAEYTNLPPGDYEFQLQTSAQDDDWEGPILKLPLHLEPALHQRGSVRVAAVVLAVGIVALLFWRRNQAALSQQHLLEQKVEERTQALASAVNAAQAASRAKTEFLATMSHEIRTPMNGVLGAVQLLDESELDPDQHKLVGVIRQSGEDLVSIVDDILSLSRVEAGKLSLEIGPVSLHPLCESLIALYRPKAESKGIAISVEIDPSLPPVIATDSQRLRQILLNLIGNAVKFTETGSVKLILSPNPDATDVHFDIVDTGIGVAADKIDTLFDPFVQADSSTTRRFGGSGLGLAIVRRFAEALGGSVSLESSPGVGSRFRVALPLQPAMANSTDSPSAPAAPVPAGLCVLLAEDNAVNQMVFQRILLRLGCQVQIARHGGEALALLKQSKVDLVLMDCQMPEMDGYAATRELRSWGGKFAHLPIIAITASAMEEDRRRCFEAGMNDFLSKPLVLATLQQKLAQWSKP